MTFAIPFILCFSAASVVGLRSLQKSSVTTALDQVSPTSRVTGRVHVREYGVPFRYLTILEYRESTTGSPDDSDITDVRQAAAAMISTSIDRSPVRRLNFGALFANLGIYLVGSAGIAWVVSYVLVSVLNSSTPGG